VEAKNVARGEWILMTSHSSFRLIVWIFYHIGIKAADHSGG